MNDVRRGLLGGQETATIKQDKLVATGADYPASAYKNAPRNQYREMTNAISAMREGAPMNGSFLGH